MTHKFVKGDIVRFKDDSTTRPNFLTNRDNIFEIVSIEGSKVKLSQFCYDIETVLSELSPVRMDGVEDRSIYYDPIIAASYVMPGDPIPVHYKNYTYYLDANARFDKNKTMRDFIKENGFTFVHELQHYLRDNYHNDYLKLNV